MVDDENELFLDPQCAGGLICCGTYQPSDGWFRRLLIRRSSVTVWISPGFTSGTPAAAAIIFLCNCHSHGSYSSSRFKEAIKPPLIQYVLHIFRQFSCRCTFCRSPLRFPRTYGGPWCPRSSTASGRSLQTIAGRPMLMALRKRFWRRILR